MNGTRYTSNMNTEITEAPIPALYSPQTDDNSISAQVQMPHMGRQILVNSGYTNNDVSVKGPGSSKQFISSITIMEGFQVGEYQKSLPETTMSLQIILPSMMVTFDIIVPFISIVTSIPIVLVRASKLCHQYNKYSQLLHSSTSWQLQIMLQS